jgi:hypothetical protein
LRLILVNLLVILFTVVIFPVFLSICILVTQVLKLLSEGCQLLGAGCGRGEIYLDTVSKLASVAVLSIG